MASSEDVIVDPDGDVTLLCGDQSDERKCIKIRVSSALLQRASPVFKAMLSNRFREGNELSSSASVEIPLPEDEPDVMEILCNIIHMRYDGVPKSMDMDYARIVRFLQLCDKYACAPAVRPSASIWIRKTLVQSDNKTRCVLLDMAKQIKDLELMRDVSRDIVMKSTENDGLPASLQAMRTNAMTTIATHIDTKLENDMSAAQARVQGTHECLAAHRSLATLLGQLCMAQLWPIKAHGGKRVEELLSTLEALRLKNLDYLQP
ncbi:hypothetical protein LTR08_002950 [Meristemomyces frigidus]|nr:hypothetical protein LTR08_002950 [Meristemomyces frigidus]